MIDRNGQAWEEFENKEMQKYLVSRQKAVQRYINKYETEILDDEGWGEVKTSG